MATAPIKPSRTSSPAKFFFGELVDALEQALAEGALVGAAVVGVLAVDEAEVILAVGIGVGEGELDPVFAVVENS